VARGHRLMRLRRAVGAVVAALLAAAAVACVDTPMGIPAVEETQRPGDAGVNPLAGAVFYVDPESNARRQVQAWAAVRPGDAAALARIAEHGQADWFGDWNADVRAAVASRAAEIGATGALPVFVAYNIPYRDCGGHSGGGGASGDSYRSWIRAFAAGIGGRRAVVILEPDALPALDCLSAAERTHRLELLRDAVDALKALPHTAVYIDAGHPHWHAAETIADRLRRAGIDRADGFSLNVSNFYATSDNTTFGDRLARLLGGARYVIDTSRNGRGATADHDWCNARQRGLGDAPSAHTGYPRVDAFLWIKRPGESDGPCNGGPAAGVWWPEYALELALGA
jgi:endoglucanase